MKNFLNIFQSIIRIILIFSICYIWLKFGLNSTYISLIISSVLTFIIEAFLHLISMHKGAKINLATREKEEAEDMFFSLASDDKAPEFFYALLSLKYKKISKKEDYLLIEIESKQVVFYPILKIEKINCDDILKVVKKTSKNSDKIIIICGEYDTKSKEILRNFNKELIILDKYQTYASIYKEFDYYPQIKQRKTEKKTFKSIIASSLNKSKAKGYIFSAFILLFSSFFIQTNIYFCVFASILLILAIFSLSNTKYNTVPNSKIL